MTSLSASDLTSQNTKTQILGFLGGPVVRTRCFHCCGLGLTPGYGTKVPQALRCDINKYNSSENQLPYFLISKSPNVLEVSLLQKTRLCTVSRTKAPVIFFFSSAINFCPDSFSTSLKLAHLSPIFKTKKLSFALYLPPLFFWSPSLANFKNFILNTLSLLRHFPPLPPFNTVH